VTYDLTVSVAKTLAKLNPTMTFIYVSGAGTDSTERGRRRYSRYAAASLALVFPCYIRAILDSPRLRHQTVPLFYGFA